MKGDKKRKIIFTFKLIIVIYYYMYLDVFRKSFKVLDIDFEIHVKNWFRHDAQRFGRESRTQ